MALIAKPPASTRSALAAVLAAAVCLVLAAPGPATGASETLAKIAERGSIALGHRRASRPFSFVDANGDAIGYSLELCLRVAKAVEAHLDRPLRIRYVEVDAKERLGRVRDGTIDLECGNSTRTLTRQAKVDFSSMIFVTGAGLLSRAEAGVQSFADLAGRRVSVVAGTTTERVLRARLAARGLAATVVTVTDHDESLAALAAGTVDAHAADRIVLIGLRNNHPTPERFTVAAELFTYEPYALMMRQGDPEFRLLVDRTLAQLYRDGRIIEIYNRWFSELGSPSELLRHMYALHGFPD